MKKNMISVTLISLIGILISGAMYYFTMNRVFFSVAITCGTILYHFAVRLAVGLLIDVKYHNQMDYTKKWFAKKSL